MGRARIFLATLATFSKASRGDATGRQGQEKLINPSPNIQTQTQTLHTLQPPLTFFRIAWRCPPALPSPAPLACLALPGQLVWPCAFVKENMCHDVCPSVCVWERESCLCLTLTLILTRHPFVSIKRLARQAPAISERETGRRESVTKAKLSKEIQLK